MALWRPDFLALGPVTANQGAGGNIYDTLYSFLSGADDLAQSRLHAGTTATAIWPRDCAAKASRGQYILAPDLPAALKPSEKIRSTVGHRMDIMVRFYSIWHDQPCLHSC